MKHPCLLPTTKWLMLIALALGTAPPVAGQSSAGAPAAFDALCARSIGPVNMGGRVVAIDVVQSSPNIIYMGAATGGVWKSTDAGKSWQSIFDQAGSLCIGAVTVSPSNPNIVWSGEKGDILN